MSRRDAALILGMCAWVKQQVKRIEDKAKVEVDVRFPEERLSGSVGDVVVSNTSRVQPQPKLKVEDEQRFAEWCVARWPDVTVPHVAEWFKADVLQRMLDNPAGVLEDASGEVCMWVELTDSTPYTRTSLAKNGGDTLAPLLEGYSLTGLLTAIEEDDLDARADSLRESGHHVGGETK